MCLDAKKLHFSPIIVELNLASYISCSTYMKLLCRWPQLALKVRYTDSLNINAGPFIDDIFIISGKYRASNYDFTGQSFSETVIWLFCRAICWWFSEKMYTDYIAWYKGFQSQKMCYLCQICNDLKTGQEFESIEIEIVRKKICTTMTKFIWKHTMKVY